MSQPHFRMPNLAKSYQPINLGHPWNQKELPRANFFNVIQLILPQTKKERGTIIKTHLKLSLLAT
jgi:hypothetical protein